MGKRLEHFGCSILVCIVIPLLPLIVSTLVKGEAKYTDIIFTAAVFPISLFIQSKHIILFMVGVTLITLFCCGLSIEKESNFLKSTAIVCICGVSMIHTYERARMHIFKGEKFIIFEL